MTKKRKCALKAKRRTTSRNITIIPDKDRLFRKLLRAGFCQTSVLHPTGIRSWTVFDEYEIVLKYRRIMVGLVNYYRNCDQTYPLNRISYIL